VKAAVVTTAHVETRPAAPMRRWDGATEDGIAVDLWSGVFPDARPKVGALNVGDAMQRRDDNTERNRAVTDEIDAALAALTDQAERSARALFAVAGDLQRVGLAGHARRARGAAERLLELPENAAADAGHG